MAIPPPPAGEQKEFDPWFECRKYKGRLRGVIDIGTQGIVYKAGEDPEYKNQIILLFEFPDNVIKYEDDDGKEHSFDSYCSWIGVYSYYKNAHLRRMIRSWIGRDLTSDEAGDNREHPERAFNPASLLGKAVVVDIEPLTEGKFKGFPKVMNLDKPIDIDGDPIKVSALKSELIEYSVRDHNQEEFDKIPDFLKKKVRTAKEWLETMETVKSDNDDDAPAKGMQDPATAGKAEVIEPEVVDDEDLPF